MTLEWKAEKLEAEQREAEQREAAPPAALSNNIVPEASKGLLTGAKYRKSFKRKKTKKRKSNKKSIRKRKSNKKKLIKNNNKN